MRVPGAATLLEVWDAGAQVSSAQRALLLLQTVRSEPIDELSRMPLGRVAAELLKLHARLVGPVLTCLVNCRQCDTLVESELQVDDLLALAAPAQAGDASRHRLREGEFDIEFRLPTSADLLALRGQARPAARTLAGALLVSASHAGAAATEATLPPELFARLERAVLEADPLARIELSFACPECATPWTESLNVGDFVWTELSHHAERLLYDVARLASAFGWREADILEMSNRRRQHYLDLLPS